MSSPPNAIDSISFCSPPSVPANRVKASAPSVFCVTSANSLALNVFDSVVALPALP